MTEMDQDDVVARRYLTGEYLAHNPSWDSEDSAWKAGLVIKALRMQGIQPTSLADVGCGAGLVLAELRRSLVDTRLVGFEIAPDARRFWDKHAGAGIEFHLGDFFSLADRHYDVLLVLDVVEHLRDPHDFLVKIRGYADHFVFHFPLDLSALNVLREAPLLNVRSKVGHIHYFTRRLALSLLEESGFEAAGWFYTGATFSAPQRTWKTRFAALFRRMAYALSKDFGVRLLGGETLIVVASPANQT